MRVFEAYLLTLIELTVPYSLAKIPGKEMATVTSKLSTKSLNLMDRRASACLKTGS